MEIIKIEELNFTYPLKEKKALDNINLSIENGDFLVICGKSGCGKSTLLRHLKTTLTPHGTLTGDIKYEGVDLNQVNQRTQAGEIGFVLQNPDNQIVTDKVWHEVAFGLESLGYDNETIRLRVAEMTSYFGIQEWFLKDVTELSGGQKQLLNLASIMAMNPKILILDEPTSQLDPIAASEFLETIKKINMDLGITIVMTEHRLEEVFPMADRIIVMEEGRVIVDDSPENVGEELSKVKNDMFTSLPTPMKVYLGLDSKLKCPITVRDGRGWLNKIIKKENIRSEYEPQKDRKKEGEPIIRLKDIWFKYGKNSSDILKNLSLNVYKGEVYSIVGGNGTGKTTTLSIISGINKAYRGKVFIKGKEINKYSTKELFNNNLGVLPQNPQSLFVKKTIKLDLMEVLFYSDISEKEKEDRVIEVARLVDIEGLLSMHPYDLSGGEQQKAALAKILLLNPQIILLDEPTKGIDNHYKMKLGSIINKLKESGVTIIMVTHDIEFAAMYSDTCGMFFNGNIVTSSEPKKFFGGNNFYTTSANKMSRHIFKDAVTCEDVIKLCKMNM
ncbi:ABC transporter ATP-binding protein [Clostridium sp. LP20]|uniref:ABC transporter ATP-binding protein n=1 Tax=Clostridium sp. LP20 TaxID=3418665 RepID=UPI003EE518CF